MPRAAVLVGCAALSCTRLNPAYGDDASGTGGMTSGASGGQTSTGTLPPDPMTSGGTTSDDVDPETTTGEPEPEPIECWRLPLRVVPPAFVDPQGVLTSVPVLVDLSVFDQPVEPEDVRFYLEDGLLAHELDFDGVFAWVRLPRIESSVEIEFDAVLGRACEPPEALPRREVWSNGFVGVWHFDRLSKGAFLDSANGIALVPDDGSAVSADTWKLGRYLEKTTNQVLTATDARLDLSGPQDVSVMSWVRLADGQSGVLPWVNGNARHREIVSKLPGYRLAAVIGEVSEVSSEASRPFFNIAQTLEPSGQVVINGPGPVLSEEWTMLSGTYAATPSLGQCFIDDASEGVQTVALQPGVDDSQDIAVGRWLHGGLDELRISDVGRSPDWVRVQSMSMNGDLIEAGRPEPY